MMNHDSNAGGPRPANGAVRPGREMFCIHSYAGEAGPPCGWRGPLAETTIDKLTSHRHCPRCGRATLMEIPRAM
jgi:hypothetical protein